MRKRLWEVFTFSEIIGLRAVKFKPGKRSHPEHVPPKAKQGRTYEDFLGYGDYLYILSPSLFFISSINRSAIGLNT